MTSVAHTLRNYLRKVSGMSYYSFEEVPIDEIKVSELHCGNYLLRKKFEPIMKAYENGQDNELPKIFLWEIDGNLYLSDGQHRTAIRKHEGHEKINSSITHFPEKPSWFDTEDYIYTADHLVKAIEEGRIE